MAEPDKTEPQQVRGRFKKGQSGNPKGRPLGSRHKVSVLVESMIQGEAESLANTAITLAKAGDPGLLKALLDRLAPPRREATITVALPEIRSAADLPAAAAALVNAVADGAITPSEGQGLATLLEAYRKHVEIADLEARIAKLEEAAGARNRG
jgi:hypothetical protein